MCGRFAFASSLEQLEKEFPWVKFRENVSPRYNLTPSQRIWGVRAQEPEAFAWGLPGWQGKSPLINARAESLLEKKTFRDLALEQRCVIFASGFYEWEAAGCQRNPYYFHLPGHLPFGLAAIWQQAAAGAPQACLITVEAAEPVAKIHHRCPAVLTGEEAKHWLQTPQLELLRPNQHLLGHPVGHGVSKRGAEGVELLLPRNDDEQLRF